MNPSAPLDKHDSPFAASASSTATDNTNVRNHAIAGNATSSNDVTQTNGHIHTSSPSEQQSQHEWNFQDALTSIENRDTLNKLCVWSAVMCVLPLTVFYSVYQLLLYRSSRATTTAGHDTDLALEYAGTCAACSVLLVGVAFGVYAYYDDDNTATNAASGVNWIYRNEVMDAERKKTR